jgi:hypothetical protein
LLVIALRSRSAEAGFVARGTLWTSQTHIKKVKEDYKIKLPFWLSTFVNADVFSIEEGRVSEATLVRHWKSEEGKNLYSPLDTGHLKEANPRTSWIQ